MNIALIGLVAILAYLGSAALIFKEILTSASHRMSMRCAKAAAGLHALYFILLFERLDAFSFSFFNTASLVGLVVTLLLLFAALNKPVEKLGSVIFPVAATVLALDLAFPERNHPVATHSWQMTVHILSSIIAFSLLNIAALQAILLAIQDRQLKSRHPKPLVASLPPLQAMEFLLFQMIGAGLTFLSISLISGFVFIEDLFAQHLAHKTVLSIIAWVIFSALLFGRLRYGWRGQTTIRWTLAGFVILLLAYFGSKMVLEIVLQKV